MALGSKAKISLRDLLRNRSIISSIAGGIRDAIGHLTKLVSCALNVVNNLVDPVEAGVIDIGLIKNLTDTLAEIGKDLEDEDNDTKTSSTTESSTTSSSSSSCTVSTAVPFMSGATSSFTVATITKFSCSAATIAGCTGSGTTVTTTTSTSGPSCTGFDVPADNIPDDSDEDDEDSDSDVDATPENALWLDMSCSSVEQGCDLCTDLGVVPYLLDIRVVTKLTSPAILKLSK
ncbi:hypothetical protein B0O99DRAFT_602397 [Bisporella sp. PMI_857]|nr:hypothetical protein B0O99DRAFT_602397 [Bisporella sp. PMI_857]